MGYYTRYKLEISDEPIGLSEAFDKISDYGDGHFEQLLSGDSEEYKWYEHDANMIAISSQFPDVLFTLSGEGEESGDIWVKYYKKGKVQVERAEIKLGKFNPRKLKTFEDD